MAEWAQRLERELRRHGWSVVELSRRSGVSLENLYKYVRGGVAQPRGETIPRLAAAIGVHEYWLLRGRGPRVASVPLVGYVSGGEEFYPIDDLSQGAGLESIPLSLDAEDPVAIRVRGVSMSPVYRAGDDLFCSRLRGVNVEDAVGRDCVVMTTSGAGYIKNLRRLPDGSFILRSYNPAYQDIDNVEIEWVAPVIFIRRAF